MGNSTKKAVVNCLFWNKVPVIKYPVTFSLEFVLDVQL